MAEDLSIKVKVEPDGGSVQGKLDEIAKDKKFNVQIGDKNLKTQLKSISKTISGTLEKAMANTMKAIDDYAESAQQAANVIEQAQKREQAALTSNINLLTGSVQKRKEIASVTQEQIAAQKQLNEETKLTATQERELKNSINKDTEISILNTKIKQYQKIKENISDIRTLINEVNKETTNSNDSGEAKKGNDVSNEISSFQQNLLSVLTDPSLKKGLKESSDNISEDINTYFSLISNSFNRGTTEIKNTIANVENESNKVKQVFNTFEDIANWEDVDKNTGESRYYSFADYVDDQLVARGEDSAKIAKKFETVISAMDMNASEELNSAALNYTATLKRLFEKLNEARQKVLSSTSTEEEVKTAAKDYQEYWVEIASTIGVLPDSVKNQMVSGLDSVIQTAEGKIEQRKRELQNKITGISSEQTKLKTAKESDLDDTEITARIKTATETIISQLNTMTEKQDLVTAAKQKTLEAEQSIVKATQESINALQTLVKQKEQIAEEISKLKSEATGITNGKDKADDAKTLLETLSAINPSKVKDVLDKVSAFVNSVAESNPKLETTKTKAAEFNAAIESINKTLAISTAFLTSLTKEDKTAKGKRGGKKTQKADTTEVDEAVKLQQLVLNAEKAADAVKNAITRASNSINTITAELKTAATSADGAKEATSPMIEAAIALNDTFKQYSDIDNITSGLDAKLAKAQQSTVDAQKAKTDIVNGFAEITAVFNSLTNAAKSITDSMTDLAKLKTMTDKVNMDQFADLINNSVDEQIKKISTKIRKDAMLQTSPNNDRVTSLAMKTGNIGSMIKQMPDGAVKDSYTKQFAELNDDITAFYNGSEKAATTWADIVSRTTEMAEGVKQVNKETQEAAKAAAQSAIKSAQNLEQRQALATELQQRFDALNNTIAKGKEIEGNGKAFNEFHSALEQIEVDAKRLGPQLESALDKKDIVSLKALTDYDKNLTDIEQRIAKVTDGVISTTSKAVKSVADQKEELKNIDPTAAINKALNLKVDGAESAKITRLRKELEESKTTIADARKAYEDDWSSDNFDKLVTAMKNGQDAANKFTTAVKTANDTMADNGTRSNERQFEQIKDFLANYQTMLTALQRSAGNKGFKQRDDYQQTESALKKMVEEAEKVKSAADVPTFIATMANKFKDAKTPIESVSDALNVVKTKIGETKAKADEFNGTLKSQRDVNTYIKSVSNSLYTAQRYLSNNSKITTDPAMYARYLEYIERYQKLLESGKITQQNGQEYASKASKEFAELKKAVQDAGLETDTLAMKFKKLFETNIKSQFASQVINMVEQGLRQIYQNVVNIDSAMTELKKVTNETDNTYDAFLDDAGTRAKNLGASISDIVTASADFARLGYNLKDSKELADAAVLYQHVGDGISSVNDASESIISTMKAFGVEAKDVTGIVDKFNEVGKQHCPKFTISVKGWRHSRPRKDMEFNDNFLYGNREVIFLCVQEITKVSLLKEQSLTNENIIKFRC